MRANTRALLTALVLLAAAIPARGADNCTGSVEALVLNQPSVGTLVGMTNDFQLSGSACFTGLGQTANAGAQPDAIYSFTAPAAGTYSFKATLLTGTWNPLVYVTSACETGTVPITVASCVKAANRNSASSNPTAVEIADQVALTASQTVYVVVDAAAVTTAGTFSLVAEVETPEVEPNDTPGTANPLSFPNIGGISPTGEADFFSLGSPAAGSRVFAMIEAVGSATTDYDMRVTTATDTLEYDDLNGDIAFGNLSPVVAGTPLTGAPAFLRVNHFSATTAGDPYRLYAVVQPALASAAPEAEPNDTTATATSATANYYTGTLATGGDTDLYSFPAAPGDVLFVALDADPLRDATPFNFALALLDGSGTVLVSVNDGGSTSSTTSGAGSLTATTPNSPAEGLVYRVPAGGGGTFYARVTLGGGTIGTPPDYLLSISKNGLIGASVPVLLQRFSVE